MLEFIIIILGISLLIYILLGGADFGAGIIETLAGKRGINTISKAIAPIWEANHIWLILAVVIIFNGFPTVYSTISTYLHIPIIIILTGIILRGTAFTFRYYDVVQDNTGEIYTWLFRISSFLTPIFLGICLGALAIGKIPAEGQNISFFQAYMAPWLNSFSFAMGIFTTLIFGSLAGIYLIGETRDEEEQKLFISISKYLFLALIITGSLVFLTAEFNGLHLFRSYLHNPISIACIAIATLLIPVVYISINKGKVTLSRMLIGSIVTIILTGYIAEKFPEIVNLTGEKSLTFYNTAATSSTLNQLGYALIVGVLIIIPSLAYLFKVFKYNKESKENLQVK